MHLKKISFVLLSLVLSGNTYALSFTQPITIKTQKYNLHFKLAVTNTPKARALGLMFVKHLKVDHGMLFTYPREQVLSFWMKNTLIPLDILYLNSKKRIVDIQTMTPCRTDYCISYPSKEPAQYAIEINGELAKKLGIKKGDLVN
jgi:uncharacterized protein